MIDQHDSHGPTHARLITGGLARALNGASATVYKWERGTCPIPRSVELLLLWLKYPCLKPKAWQCGKLEIFP